MAINTYLIPSGDIDESILYNIIPNLEIIFRTNFYVHKDNFPLLSEAYDKKRDQYMAEIYLEYIKALDLYKNDSNKLLVVTSVDLFSPMLNFVFGMAEHPGKCAIVSMYRINSDRCEKKNRRLQKEITHELGHTFGLSHCSDPKCVMSFSVTIEDVDRKENVFCKNCDYLLANSFSK